MRFTTRFNKGKVLHWGWHFKDGPMDVFLNCIKKGEIVQPDFTPARFSVITRLTIYISYGDTTSVESTGSLKIV